VRDNIIYVDFKSASKKSKHKNKYKNSESHYPKQKKSFIKIISEKVKHIFNKIFKRTYKYNNSNPPKYKHWL
jgi:hypothetical protein